MKRDKLQQGFTLLEFIFVIVMIGILSATALKYYADIVDDARVASVQFLSARFAAAVAGIHMKWMIDGQPARIELDGYQLKVNDNGWPVGEPSLKAKGRLNTCQQLWESLLQNPSQLPDVIPRDSRGVQYWSAKPKNKVCRYNLITRDSSQYYFEYHMDNGRVRSVTDYLK
jgi:prepilin-type N-terminal cleavage/methylation domain-containing protein